ncbi:hypothetical protein ACOI9H_13745, partial [Corynebacterium striatum]|uniref:hypothetical protein n=4 Tax=Corynebacterium striatum TaxID=43770 RepID=UPI003B595578
RHIFRQDAVLNETDHAVLRILVKFPWHVPDFPIYSNGTKPGALHSWCNLLAPDDFEALTSATLTQAA